MYSSKIELQLRLV